jgi:hypothetical protein
MRKILGWVLVALGAIGLLLVGPTVAKFATVIVRSGSAPVATTVAAAPADTWVRLTDAVLRCETRKVVAGRVATTIILGRDAAGAHPFVASFTGEVGCDAAGASVDGVFMPGVVDAEALGRAGVDVRGEKDLRFLSQALRPAGMKVALRRGIAWLLASALLVVLGVLSLRREARRAAA